MAIFEAGVTFSKPSSLLLGHCQSNLSLQGSTNTHPKAQTWLAMENPTCFYHVFLIENAHFPLPAMFVFRGVSSLGHVFHVPYGFSGAQEVSPDEKKSKILGQALGELKFTMDTWCWEFVFFLCVFV